MTVGLNMGEYLHELEGLIAETPWQLTYLADDVSDLLILEPELGIVKDVSEFFGRQADPDRYFIIHTKSANVEFLRDVEHRGHTIMCWSLSARTQSTELEALSGTTEQRIEAAARCQAWGLPVRFKFKPFIPVRGWRDEARDMIRLMFDRTRPDNLSMTVLMWMPLKDVDACIGLDRLDPEFVDAARRYADHLDDEFVQTGPFPPEVRQTVYEFLLREIREIDREVPVTMSTESLDLWRMMGPQLGVKPGEYVCGCGPCATPGLKRLPVNAWRIAREGLPARVAAPAPAG
jgi:spore photoproduct lyase